jgi:trans-aconitate methyltransferase
MTFDGRFGAAAGAYREFRPEYPEALFERILEHVPPQARQRAIDLGAGTGLVALPLARRFDEVVAVEPDARMTAELTAASPRIVVRSARAEDVEEPPRSADLVTIGTALHWMDGPLVVAKAARWLRPGRALAVFRYGFPRVPEALWPTLKAELARWSPFRDPRLLDEDYARRTVEAAAGYSSVHASSVPNVVPLHAAGLVGFCRSTSYCAAWLRSLPDPDRYLEQFERTLRDLAGDGPMPIDFELELLIAIATA